MFNFSVRVYYEDTDSGGVVYYANYLKFTERARTNMIQELGFTLNQLHDDHDCIFIVKKVNCEYLQSAKLEDFLEIQSSIIQVKNASFELEQNILRDGKIIFQSNIIMVCVNSQGQPKKIPEKISSLLR
jgi:acyl-CoA thioester hydrolase